MPVFALRGIWTWFCIREQGATSSTDTYFQRVRSSPVSCVRGPFLPPALCVWFILPAVIELWCCLVIVTHCCNALMQCQWSHKSSLLRSRYFQNAEHPLRPAWCVIWAPGWSSLSELIQARCFLLNVGGGCWQKILHKDTFFVEFVLFPCLSYYAVWRTLSFWLFDWSSAAGVGWGVYIPCGRGIGTNRKQEWSRGLENKGLTSAASRKSWHLQRKCQESVPC